GPQEQDQHGPPDRAARAHLTRIRPRGRQRQGGAPHLQNRGVLQRRRRDAGAERLRAEPCLPRPRDRAPQGRLIARRRSTLPPASHPPASRVLPLPACRRGLVWGREAQPGEPTMARAIRFYETGGPEVMRVETAAVGEPGPEQARVRHSYVAVNFIDVYFRTGRYPLPLPNGLGSDAVGVVEAVGSGVTDIRVGDRVGYLLGPQGAYSDVRVMPADGISDRTASTLMMKGMTAQYLFRQVYPLHGGETILFHAAAGGV